MSTVAKLQTATKVTTPPPTSRPLHRFTVEQYHRMAEIGVITPGDRVELIRGQIVDKMTQNPPHASAVSRVNRLLGKVVPEEWALRVQAPITLRDSEPEPDFAIAVGPEEVYSERHPAPRDLALVIEVGDSTLLQDRRSKLPLYAGERIVQCWLINLVDRRVEVYGKPKAGKEPAYQERRDYGKDAEVPLVLNGKRVGSLHVCELLPARTVS